MIKYQSLSKNPTALRWLGGAVILTLALPILLTILGLDPAKLIYHLLVSAIFIALGAFTVYVIYHGLYTLYTQLRFRSRLDYIVAAIYVLGSLTCLCILGLNYYSVLTH